MSPTVIPFPATSPDSSAVARLLRSSNGTSISSGTMNAARLSRERERRQRPAFGRRLRTDDDARMRREHDCRVHRRAGAVQRREARALGRHGEPDR